VVAVRPDHVNRDLTGSVFDSEKSAVAELRDVSSTLPTRDTALLRDGLDRGPASAGVVREVREREKNKLFVWR
jgi:hypothetical protein